MQFTFITLYLLYYFLTLFILLTVILFFLPLFFYSKFSFNIIFNYIKTYTLSNNLIYICFFLFSGLPPVGLFFIKFNFIIYLWNYWYFFTTIFFFFFFFVNMIFYLNIFKYKVNWSYINPLLLDNILNYKWALKSKYFYTENLNLTVISNGVSLYFYNLLFFINFLSFFLFFNFFFFTDSYLIVLNLTI